FTGGIGENSAEIRRRCVSMLAPFGLSLDPDRNARHGASSRGCIQGETSTPILVIPADEEAAIAEETARALA
ncbi:MAG: acetate kinase, partial [Myxococcota bacterium]